MSAPPWSRSVAAALVLASGALATVRCADLLGMTPPTCGDAGCPDANAVDDGSAGDSGCPTGFVCAASVPTWWNGPVALAISADGGPPSCGGSYAGVGPTGYFGLHVPDASCACDCAASTTCGSAVVETWSSLDCVTNPGAQTTVTTSCTVLNDSQGVASLVNGGAPTTLCDAGPVSADAGPVTWDARYAVCGYSGAPATSCSGGSCVARPTGALGSSVCVYQQGDVACPGAPYTQRTVVMTGIDDQRGCGACSCTPSGGACSPTITLYQQTNCAGPSLTVSPGSPCGNTSASGNYFLGGAKITNTAVTQGSCVPSVHAKGTATATNPITVCCAP